MMIPPASASASASATAAIDRTPAASGDSAGAQTDAPSPDSGPDVIVTLGGATQAPATYNASGRLSSASSTTPLGPDAPDALAKASETRGDGATPDAATASASQGGADASANIDEQATAAA